MDIFEFLDRPIAYHRSLVPLAGTAGAIFLSQAIYWSKRTSNPDLWFYKTAEEWEDETGLTRRVQERVREELRAKGILEEKLADNPAKLYFRVNQDKLLSFYETLKQVSTKSENKFRQKVKPLYTENTTKITHTTEERKTPFVVEKNSKNSILPLTDLDRWELATSLHTQLDVVRKTEAAFWDYIEDPRKRKKYKTSYLTIKQWVRRRLEEGTATENNEIEAMLLENQHPDMQAKIKWASEQAQKRGDV